MKLTTSIYLFMASVLLFFHACTPEQYDLGVKDVTPDDLVEGLAYTVTHDANNPNIVYLESKMGGSYTPLWSHPQGRSQEQKVTLKIAFPGTYEVKFGVQTRGGVVYGSPVTFTIDDFYAEFVSDELWTLLSGGVGAAKTWYLDLDAEGVSRYFIGPLYFYGTDDSWETVTNGVTLPDGSDSWNWNPDWPGNSWLMDAADFGSMTFDLIEGANVVVEHKTIPARGTERGTYMLDVDEHTLRMTDASPLHDINRDGVVIDWGDIKIMSLTENTLQLAVLRDPELSGEGAALLVYNFISKEYFDNWTPGEQEDPEPSLPDNWLDDVSQTVQKTIIWKLSETNPLDWCNLDGSRMNGWNRPEDYPDWLGTPDPAVYGEFSLTLDSEDMKATFKLPDGTELTMNYSLDDKGIYTFDDAVPDFSIIGQTSFHLDANRQLRIMSIDKDASGHVSGIWLGARDPVKPEYMAYHLIPSAGGSSTSDPLRAWKNAFAGKTFKPDVHWFVDWVGGAPDFSGGWTSPSMFGDDYTSNGWVWDANVRAVAESASLVFELDGDKLKVELTQLKEGVDYSASGEVIINAADNILNISIPLVDYAGTAASWLGTVNDKSPTGNSSDWFFVPHGGANLSNIDTQGFWLGRYTSSKDAGDENDEVLIFHYVLAE